MTAGLGVAYWLVLYAAAPLVNLLAGGSEQSAREPNTRDNADQ